MRAVIFPFVILASYSDTEIDGGALNKDSRRFHGIIGGAYNLHVSFASSQNEKLFGMGQYQQDDLDLNILHLNLHTEILRQVFLLFFPVLALASYGITRLLASGRNHIQSHRLGFFSHGIFWQQKEAAPGSNSEACTGQRWVISDLKKNFSQILMQWLRN